MNFRVGDLVWCHYSGNKYPGEIIDEYGASQPDRYVVLAEGFPSNWPGGSGWPTGSWNWPPRWLSPRNPGETKREEIGSWDLCPWQPKGVRVE